MNPKYLNTLNEMVKTTIATTQAPSTISRYIKPRASKGDKGNELVFELKDVYSTNHSLTRILRYIFVMHGITMADFEHYVERFGAINNIDVSTTKGNLKKEIYKVPITYGKFEQIVSNILGYEVQNVTFELKNTETGQLHNYSLLDTVIMDNMEYINYHVLEKEQEKIEE